MNTDLIIKPAMTEKAQKLSQGGKYLFFVRDRANKTEIKKVIKELYQVDVSKVNILKAPSKSRMQKRGVNTLKRHALKKAIVTIKGKKNIDIYKVKVKK